MSLAYIRDYYAVPAYEGVRVKFSWYTPPIEGTVVGSEDHYLLVLLDGDSEPKTLHPTWKLSYKDGR